MGVSRTKWEFVGEMGVSWGWELGLVGGNGSLSEIKVLIPNMSEPNLFKATNKVVLLEIAIFIEDRTEY